MTAPVMLLIGCVVGIGLTSSASAQPPPRQANSARPQQPDGLPPRVAPGQNNEARLDQPEPRATAEATGFPFEVPPVPLRAASFPVPEGAIWVSPDGLADQNGRDRDRATTLRQALTSAPAGSTVVLTGGLYRDGEFFITRELHLQNAPGEVPVIKGSDVVTEWTKDGDYWRAAWEKQFPPYGYLLANRQRVQAAQYPMALHGDQVFVDDIPVFQVSVKEKLGPGRFWLDGDNKMLWIGTDPTGRRVESTAKGFGIRFGQSGEQNAAGSSLRGLHLMHFATGAGGVAVPRVTVEGCTFAFAGERGFNFHPFDGNGRGLPPDDCVFRRNVLWGNGLVGVSGGTFKNLLFEQNHVAYNNLENFRFTWSASGVKFVKNKNLILRDNLVENNNSMGLWVDVDVDDVSIYRNVARGNRIIGIFFEVCDGAVIAQNWCQDNNVGIQTSNSAHAKIWNNTLVDNKQNVRFQWWRRVNQESNPSGGVPPQAIYQSFGHELWNNLSVMTRPDRDAHVVADADPKGSASHLAASGHNLFLQIGQGQAVPLARWSAVAGEQVRPISEIESLRHLAPGLEEGSRAWIRQQVRIDNLRVHDPDLDAARPAPLTPGIAEALGMDAESMGFGAQNADFSRVP